MSLSLGTRLGAYEIISLLGVGGMGEVYRARDSKLNRDVALKVLPELFATDPDRVARFQREAQILASLNHPNIAAIYGLEESGAVRALVLELVEGPTLEETIARRSASGPPEGGHYRSTGAPLGPSPVVSGFSRTGAGLPLDEVLSIARQVSEALEAAHEQGVTHRDLKPANIKVRPNGTVKVLDFGLAKLVDPSGAGASTSGQDLTASPTMTDMATRAGIILGTAAYMSPEQARGKTVDRRADIWAFGCVLYEMLTGKRTFEGDTLTDVMAAVVKNEPDWQALPPDTPDAIRSVLRRCLHKDVSRRLQHVGDARIEILEALSEPAGSHAVVARREIPIATDRRRRFMLRAAITVAVLSLALAMSVLWFRNAPPAPRPLGLFNIAAPAGADRLSFVSVSPTGAELALVGEDGRRDGIWIRRRESLQPRRVLEYQGSPTVFWSPDGQSLGYFEGGKLKILDVSTGQTRIVCDAPNGFGGSWGTDQTILFTPDASSGIHRVSARGGTVTAITSPSATPNEPSHRWPQWLPDGRQFLFVTWTGPGQPFTIRIGSLDSQTSRAIGRSKSAALYVPPGYLLFIEGEPGRLVAMPFDAAASKITGTASTIAEDLLDDWQTGALPVTGGSDGALTYLNDRDRPSRLTWFDRSGRQGDSLGDAAIYFDPALSADGKSLVVEKADPNIFAGDLWIVDLMRRTFSRVTHEPSFDNVGVWSPDGHQIVFSSDRGTIHAMLITATDGSGAASKLLEVPGSRPYAMDWSADGKYLLYTTIDEKNGRDLWALPMTGSRTPIPVLRSDYRESHGRFSPDGRWIAYASNESGDVEVYVRAWPDGQIRRQVSSKGGREPQWRGDGKELFYRSSDGDLMAVSISASGSSVNTGDPQPLFNPGMNESGGFRTHYAVTSDGQRFLVLKPVVDRRTAPVTTILNWPALMGK